MGTHAGPQAVKAGGGHFFDKTAKNEQPVLALCHKAGLRMYWPLAILARIRQNKLP